MEDLIKGFKMEEEIVPYPSPKHTWFISTKECRSFYLSAGGPSEDLDVVLKDFIRRMQDRELTSMRSCRIQKTNHWEEMHSGRYSRAFHGLLTYKFDETINPNDWRFSIIDKRRQLFNRTRPYGVPKRKATLTKTWDEMKKLIKRRNIVHFSVSKS